MKNQPAPEPTPDGSIKKSISLPIPLFNRAVAKDPSLSKVVQDALIAYLDGVTSTDRAIEQLHARLATLENILGASRAGAAASLPTNVVNFPRPTTKQGTVFMPALGAIAAGDGDSVEDLTEYHMELPASIVDGAAFALRVRGDSMNLAPEGIQNGDVVLMALRPFAAGQIVAAIVDGKTTLKRVIEENGQLILKAESTNPVHGKIFPLEDMRCQGVFVGKVPKELLPGARSD